MRLDNATELHLNPNTRGFSGRREGAWCAGHRYFASGAGGRRFESCRHCIVSAVAQRPRAPTFLGPTWISGTFPPLDTTEEEEYVQKIFAICAIILLLVIAFAVCAGPNGTPPA